MYLACIMVCIVVCIESERVCIERITIQYVPNTNTIRTDTDRNVLNTYLLVLNRCWYVFNTYHNTCQYIVCVLAYIALQYMPILAYSNHCI